MPGGVTITTKLEDFATPGLQRLGAAVQRPDVRKVMGRAMATTLRKHFSALDGERANKLGGKRTHFYGDARRGVQQPELIGGDGIKVAINQVGIAQRYFGGVIKAKPGSKLTIPVHPEAYGHRAREFGLHAIYFADGDGILVNDHTESKNNIGEVYYRLVASVHQDEDKSVLPTETELQTAAVNAGAEYLTARADS